MKVAHSTKKLSNAKIHLAVQEASKQTSQSTLLVIVWHAAPTHCSRDSIVGLRAALSRVGAVLFDIKEPYESIYIQHSLLFLYIVI